MALRPHFALSVFLSSAFRVGRRTLEVIGGGGAANCILRLWEREGEGESWKGRSSSLYEV